MSYFTRLSVRCSAEAQEILIAEIAETGFDTFMETSDGFEGFTEGDRFDAEALEEIHSRYRETLPFSYVLGQVQKQNWNEQWERSFEPVVVEDRCVVRASFHKPDRPYPYEIVVTPKMSFGTGHHQTTWLMLSMQLDLDQKGKVVMDAGCGTAILAIMACLRGAQYVDAFDIDEWSTVNGSENLQVNGCAQVRLRQGDIRKLSFDRQFDVILANINRNILLDEMPEYARYLKPGGSLVLSGFYVADAPVLLEAALPFGLAEVRRKEREGWCALMLQKGN